MAGINTALQSSVRSGTKRALKQLSTGQQRIGKQVVREGRQKLLNRVLTRHAALLQKFVSEEGKGVRISFDA